MSETLNSTEIEIEKFQHGFDLWKMSECLILTETETLILTEK
jgi:hypothetical protein